MGKRNARGGNGIHHLSEAIEYRVRQSSILWGRTIYQLAIKTVFEKWKLKPRLDMIIKN